MRLNVYRLAHVDQPLSKLARNARDFGRGDSAASRDHLRQCLTYETAELAAMCAADLLWDLRRRTELSREALTLPPDAALHEVLPAARFGLYDGDQSQADAVVDHMVHGQLLSVWLPSAHAAAQHAVFVNPLHEAFDQIVVTKRQLVLMRPSWTGSFHLPAERQAWPTTPADPARHQTGQGSNGSRESSKMPPATKDSIRKIGV